MKKPLISLETIINTYPLKLLVYFGSWATGDYQEGKSDIDIAFLAFPPLNSEEKFNLLKDLILYHRKSAIDLVDLSRADPLLKYEIATKGQVLYEDKEFSFADYSLYCLRYYYDTKYLREQNKEIFQKKLKELLSDGQ